MPSQLLGEALKYIGVKTVSLAEILGYIMNFLSFFDVNDGVSVFSDGYFNAQDCFLLFTLIFNKKTWRFEVF